jgi:tetratricopeptide (TPR) repeat protein
MATDGAIEVARGLQLQGRMIEAEALYRDLLGKQPDALKALEGLGVVLFQQGRAEEAAALFARGVAIEPQSIRFHANLRATGISALALRSKLFYHRVVTVGQHRCRGRKPVPLQCLSFVF